MKARHLNDSIGAISWRGRSSVSPLLQPTNALGYVDIGKKPSKLVLKAPVHYQGIYIINRMRTNKSDQPFVNRLDSAKLAAQKT